jgi:hypothetical protein
MISFSLDRNLPNGSPSSLLKLVMISISGRPGEEGIRELALLEELQQVATAKIEEAEVLLGSIVK